MTSKNNKYSLIVTPPEEGALAAWNAIIPLIKKLGINQQEAPMDLASRVLTNGEAVDTAIKQVKDNSKSVYLKGPGITPSDKQMLDTISKLEKLSLLKFKLNDKNSQTKLQDATDKLRDELKPNENEENMAKFAASVKNLLNKIGSPNARWRDVLEVTLERGVSDELAKRSTYKPASWNKNTPFEVMAMPQTSENTIEGKKISGGEIIIEHKAHDGSVKTVTEKLTDGSSIRLFTNSKRAISEFIDSNIETLKSSDQIIHGAKATVISVYDVSLNKILSQKLHSVGLSKKIADYALEKDKSKNIVKDESGANIMATGFLIDNAHAILANNAPTSPTTMISLNQSYASSVREFWQEVKASDGFNSPENSSIIRLSSTKDHYKPFQFIGGKIKVTDGNGIVIFDKEFGSDEIALITVLDKGRIERAVKNIFTNARNNNQNVIFGFDDNDYYAIAIDSVRQNAKNYPNVNYEILSSGKAGAKFFTGGIKNTMLVASNIMGDFLTDIELAGKGTSYSIGTLGDGRKAVELGTGGTAPDLLTMWKEQGILQFNPMAFIEGLSYGIKFLGELMKRDGIDNSDYETISKALEEALYATTDNGIILPISKGAFKINNNATETFVSTHTFVKSVELETLKLLTGKHPVASQENIDKSADELKKMLAYDKTVFALLKSDKAEEWKASNNKYNNIREQNNQLDSFNPNYSLDIPAGEINTEKLLTLQAKQIKTLKAA
ncbi:MAG: hypothetical protein R3D71_09780 [Rickettsiales bacterium]